MSPIRAQPAAPARVLVAGVGNLFLGDDGFGSEVARRLARGGAPDGSVVTDYGVGGIHLTYDLLDGYDTLILIDAARRGEEPGTVTVIEVDTAEAGSPTLDAHSLDPAAVLASVRRLGGEVPRALLVACEPQDLDEGIGLSDVVEAAVDPTLAAVRDLIVRELQRLDGVTDDEGR